VAAAARPALEVGDMLRTHGQAFLERHGVHLSPGQRRVLKELALCRTAALGGHTECCAGCGHERMSYNSCRNRHCPKCQAATRAHWLEREACSLLPVEYYHMVFTLPQALGPLALQNPRVLYDLLFRSAWDTVRELAADPHYLGATVGLLAVLHTWGQTLCHHPHLHCVVTGGGLSCAVNGQVAERPAWVACRPGFFLPVRVLSRLFRGKFLAGLRAAYAAGRLSFHGKLADLAEASAFAAWLGPLYAQAWVVYAKAPFGGPEQVLKYLARYTHRVAISNSRLVSLEAGQVAFRYKDYADDRQEKVMKLAVDEFIRRFLQHVLPSGFVKIRHYGLLANRYRAARLQVCRQLLRVVALAALVAAALGGGVAAVADACPLCGGCAWLVVGRVARPTVAEVCALPLPPPGPRDTS
jgi:Putative transposase/Transposase zinc-binding domain